MPNFRLIIENPSKNEVEIFEGIILSKGKPKKSFEQVVREYFNGDCFNILMYEHFHSIAGVNSELMESLSLSYSVRYSIFNLKQPVVWVDKPVVRGSKIIGTELKNDGIIDWIARNSLIVQKINRIYQTYTHHI